MADTITTTSSPAVRRSATRRATPRIRSASPTEVPPYFCTMRDIGTECTDGPTSDSYSARAMHITRIIPLMALVLLLAACGDDDAGDTAAPADAGIPISAPAYLAFREQAHRVRSRAARSGHRDVQFDIGRRRRCRRGGHDDPAHLVRRHHHRTRCRCRSGDGEFLRVPGSQRVLRRHGLAPDHPRLHRPGRRPHRVRLRQPRLPDPRRDCPPPTSTTPGASVAMANAGCRTSAGSQFFIMLGDAAAAPDLHGVRPSRGRIRRPRRPRRLSRSAPTRTTPLPAARWRRCTWSGSRSSAEVAVDLHTHSTYSDGTEPRPRSWPGPRSRRPDRTGPRPTTTPSTACPRPETPPPPPASLIPGVELSVDWGEGGMHLLGYWIGPGPGPSTDRLDRDPAGPCHPQRRDSSRHSRTSGSRSTETKSGPRPAPG